MNRKPFTVRQFLLVSAALAAGTSVGSAAEVIISAAGGPPAGAGQAVAGLATIWVMDKLNKLIDDHTT